MAGKRQPGFEEKYKCGLEIVDAGYTWAYASNKVGWNKNKLRHEYRLRHDPEYLDRVRRHAVVGNSKRMRELTAIIAEAKSVPCVDCDRIYPWKIMELDHVRGEKARTIGNGTGFSEESLRAEITKCDVRCPTCHRLRHLEESLAGKSDVDLYSADLRSKRIQFSGREKDCRVSV